MEGHKVGPLVCGVFGIFGGSRLWSPFTVPEECTGKDEKQTSAYADNDSSNGSPAKP